MEEQIKKQIQFVLEADNEMMVAALGRGSDLDEESKQMNRELIRKHQQILAKLDRGEKLTKEDLKLIRYANEVHVIDEVNIAGHHEQAVKLDEWLDRVTDMTRREAMEVLQNHLDADSHTPAEAYRALHNLWEEASDRKENEDNSGFDSEGKCRKCGCRVSFADVTDTLVFVGDEIVKTYDGDITNRNCVRCNYPEMYPDYQDYDK